MRKLFTGGNGYIGNFYCAHDSNCLVYDISGGDINDDIGNIYHHTDELQDIEVIIHAADIRYQAYKKDNVRYMINKHKRFIDYASTLPKVKQIIFTSSCSVYGYSGALFTETSNLNPTSYYAESKIEVEEHIRQSSFPIKTILRYGTCFGKSKNGATRYDTLLNNIMAHYQENTAINLFDPEAKRPYIYIGDFTDVLGYSIPAQLNGTYNVASFNMTKRDLVIKTSTRYTVSNVPDDRNYSVSTDKIQRAGYVSFTDFKQGWKWFLRDETI